MPRNFRNVSIQSLDPRPQVGGFCPSLQLNAHGKINLILDIVGKRTDGYHDLRTIMQKISLHDTLTFTHTQQSFRLTTNNPNLATDERNLVTRAATYLIEKYNITTGFHIHIEKNIPIAAGLGGGSSDCATALVGINRLFSLGISQEKLRKIGVLFGADVPFFIDGSTSLAEGIGDILTPITSPPPCWVVLICPHIYVSTADVFSRYRPDINHAPLDVERMQRALAARFLTEIATYVQNVLSPITEKIHPIITDIILKMQCTDALTCCMSGSGPSVFGIYDHYNKALAAQKILKSIPGDVFLCETGMQ